MPGFSVSGNFVDVWKKKTYPAELRVENNRISGIKELGDQNFDTFLMPGFIDSHVHIESSMLVPSEFARLAVVHGTVGTVSDPHEIANVCGIEGIEFMIENGKTVPFKFNFGAPSCVPATVFETAGAVLDARQVESLLKRDDIKYLSEMMNFPGVLNEDTEVMNKLAAAHRLLKPVDGHAPGLRGDDAKLYISAGITTDHECFTAAEALDKLQSGMKIIIREGSAAKNFEALIGLLNEFPNQMMLCSDDKHPDSLVEGHINQLCARAAAKGIDKFRILQAACVNPVLHYKLDIGLLRIGDPADFIVVKDLAKFEVMKTFINGERVFEKNPSQGNALSNKPTFNVGKKSSYKRINNFGCSKKSIQDFSFPFEQYETGDIQRIPVIEAMDGQLITNKIMYEPKLINGLLVSDIEDDILKIVVVNRYEDAPIAKGFIRNIGLLKGAIASSVAHDSHNIVAVGVDDESLCKAVNLVIAEKGGISCVGEGQEKVLPLPVAGLMSDADGYKVAAAYTEIDGMAKALGSRLSAPFMTLSFMALLVIPHLKISDKGMFDGDKFSMI